MQSQPQVQSRSLAMHQPHDVLLSPQDNIVKDISAQNTIGQCQSNQQHSSWTRQNPQPNQISEVEAPPNNMFVYHQDHFPGQVTHAHPPQSLPIIPIQKHQPLLPSQVTRYQYTMQQLPQQQTAASTTYVVHNQIHHEGPSYNLDIALQEHHPIPTVLGVQLNMKHFSSTAPQDAYNQASIAVATTQASISMATSQASAQSHGVNAATLIQGQWCGQQFIMMLKLNTLRCNLNQRSNLGSNQPHASWTGQNRQPNQTSEVEAHPNNMFMYHQDHFPEQDAYNQASVAMATTQASIAMDTSQASAQSHGVYAATLTQGLWCGQQFIMLLKLNTLRCNLNHRSNLRV
ncbi:hypothetical protein DY000_02017871 [Brassica cretica]|uniref:Uncharacterized protein n=1 Tax=Brassica cretica TaxID=69181 RepID=A0ABQ7D451_BRACR|nr:hypothetical protein DY000_02017871 [Brassica cretica]